MSALLVVDNPKRWPLTIPGLDVISSGDYLTDRRYSDMRAAKVFNLCRSYRYQTAGYYVSLLAEARDYLGVYEDLGLVHDIRVRGDTVHVIMSMPHRGRPRLGFFTFGSGGNSK